MSESNKSSWVSRRTILIAAAGAAPLLGLGATGAKAAKMAQSAVRYQATLTFLNARLKELMTAIVGQ